MTVNVTNNLRHFSVIECLLLGDYILKEWTMAELSKPCL